ALSWNCFMLSSISLLPLDHLVVMSGSHVRHHAGYVLSSLQCAHFPYL
ncbi:13924_t:CDS:1, partial [Ambispora leptoticha]